MRISMKLFFIFGKETSELKDMHLKSKKSNKNGLIKTTFLNLFFQKTKIIFWKRRNALILIIILIIKPAIGVKR